MTSHAEWLARISAAWQAKEKPQMGTLKDVPWEWSDAEYAAIKAIQVLEWEGIPPCLSKTTPSPDTPPPKG